MQCFYIKWKTYIVEELNLKTLVATVTKKDVSYNTEPRKTVEIAINASIRRKNLKA